MGAFVYNCIMSNPGLVMMLCMMSVSTLLVVIAYPMIKE